MKFLDQAKIYIKAGNGGNGACSFRHEKFLEFGGPDGGNGGHGGNVILKAVPNLNTLIDFRYQQHFKAENGRPGGGSQCTGAAGEDLVISVPVGTEVMDESGTIALADLTQDGQTFLVAKGGAGGRGNESYKSSTCQAPRQADKGEEGEELWVWLRLKLIADIGLIGLPNAGKSTFLTATTKARPKIANYPFTTLHPHLGVAYVDEREVLFADIPGLIEGASQGVGLGTKFLKHLSRCSMLFHLIAATDEDVVKSYKTIRKELEIYGEGLANKPEIIVLNKCDALPSEDVKKLTKKLERIGKPVFAISAVAGTGIKDLLRFAVHNWMEKKEDL